MPRFTTLKTSSLWCFSVLWKINHQSFANRAIRMFYLYFYLLPFVYSARPQGDCSKPISKQSVNFYCMWPLNTADWWSVKTVGTRYYKHTSPKGQWRLHSHITACPHPLCLTLPHTIPAFKWIPDSFCKEKKENKKLTDRLKMERHGWNANVVKCAFRLFTTKGASHL